VTQSAPTIKAIPTRYAGCHFRSRLEARWAVFFDALGVAWQYEPEGFDLDGQWYLPDFYLPTLDVWYEVKGVEPTELEQSLAGRLADGTRKSVFIAWGDIPDNPCMYGLPQNHWRNGGIADAIRDIYAFTHAEVHDSEPFGCYWDNHYAWCICPDCGVIGIEFEARAARLHGRESNCVGGEYDRGHNGNDRRLLAAYEAARSARFEHGQQG
jgi:hypothetical protein